MLQAQKLGTAVASLPMLQDLEVGQHLVLLKTTCSICQLFVLFEALSLHALLSSVCIVCLPFAALHVDVGKDTVQVRFTSGSLGGSMEIWWPDAICNSTNLTRLTIDRVKELPANLGDLVSVPASHCCAVHVRSAARTCSSCIK
jgi:hypothetical protein